MGWAKGRNTGLGVGLAQLQTTENAQACKTCVLAPASSSLEPNKAPIMALYGQRGEEGEEGLWSRVGSGEHWQAEESSVRYTNN